MFNFLKKKDPIETITKNILCRSRMYVDIVEEAYNKLLNESLLPQLKFYILFEMIWFQFHHIDRLAFEFGVSEETRINIREFMILNLIDFDILPLSSQCKLIEDGITPSVEAYGITAGDIAYKIFTPKFLKEIETAEEDYKECNAFLAKSPFNQTGFLNKLLLRTLNHFENIPDVDFFSALLKPTSKILLEKKLVKEDKKALGVFKG